MAHTVADASPRQRATLVGRICEVQIRHQGGLRFEATLDDGTGFVTLCWLGRDHIPGIEPGTVLIAEGTLGDYRGRLVILNPLYLLRS